MYSTPTNIIVLITSTVRFIYSTMGQNVRKKKRQIKKIEIEHTYNYSFLSLDLHQHYFRVSWSSVQCSATAKTKASIQLNWHKLLNIKTISPPPTPQHTRTPPHHFHYLPTCSKTRTIIPHSPYHMCWCAGIINYGIPCWTRIIQSPTLWVS